MQGSERCFLGFSLPVAQLTIKPLAGEIGSGRTSYRWRVPCGIPLRTPLAGLAIEEAIEFEMLDALPPF